jgi:ankyrin repeat protein
LCILEDATGWSGIYLDRLVRFMTFEEMEERLPKGNLDRCYWVCLFAVNPHVTAHFKVGHPRCEMDKIESVMEQMPDGLLVVLDSKLELTKRCWCMFELGVALRLKRDVKYYLPRALPQEVSSSSLKLASIRNGETSVAADKEYILKKVGNVADFDTQISKTMIPAVLISNWLRCAASGDAKRVKEILNQGVDINSALANAETALVKATQFDQVEVLEALLTARADIEKAEGGRTPLFMAAHQGHAQVTQALLDAGAVINQERCNSGTTPLFIAAQKGHFEVAKKLVDAGTAIDQAGTDGGAGPLFISAQMGHFAVVKLLVEKGASVNHATTDRGVTPLHVASQVGRPRVVELLLSARASVNEGTYDQGVTPLFITAQKGHAKTAQLLLDAGADASKKSNGVTALQTAEKKGHAAMTELLRDK